MTHIILRRSVLAVAAAASVAFLGTLGAGCTDAPDDGDGDGEFQAAVINCNALKSWAVGQTFNQGDVITFDNRPFTTLQQIRVQASDWTPVNLPGFWSSAGSCGGVVVPPVPPPVNNPPPVPPPVNNPPPVPPPVNNPPPVPPPVNNPVITNKGGEAPGFGRCNSFATGSPGPAFDAAGVANVGNGRGGQFITGRCLSNADCGSGSCAGPCGVCSGPAVCKAAGKTGCGFEFSKVTLDR
jgi:hypothetical protein